MTGFNLAPVCPDFSPVMIIALRDLRFIVSNRIFFLGYISYTDKSMTFQTDFWMMLVFAAPAQNAVISGNARYLHSFL